MVTSIIRVVEGCVDRMEGALLGSRVRSSWSEGISKAINSKFKPFPKVSLGMSIES